MIQPRYNKQNNTIVLGFDSIEINLVWCYVLWCHNHNNNITKHNLNTVDGLDMKIIVQTPSPLHPTTTETQRKPLGAPNKHLLTTTK